jgi:hypothetical protein
MDYHRDRMKDATEREALNAALAETFEELWSAEDELNAADGARRERLVAETLALRKQADMILRERERLAEHADVVEEMDEVFGEAGREAERQFASLRTALGSYEHAKAGWDAALKEHRLRLERARKRLESLSDDLSPFSSAMRRHARFQSRVEGALAYAIQEYVAGEPERKKQYDEAFRIANRASAGVDVIADIRVGRAEGVDLRRVLDRLAAEKEPETRALRAELSRMIDRSEKGMGVEEPTEEIGDFAGDIELLPPDEETPRSTLVPLEADASDAGRDTAVSAAERPSLFDRVSSAFGQVASTARKWLGTLGRATAFLSLSSFNPAVDRPMERPVEAAASAFEDRKETPVALPAQEWRTVEKRGESVWKIAESLLIANGTRATNDRAQLLTRILLDDSGMDAKSAREIKKGRHRIRVDRAKAAAKRLAEGQTVRQAAEQEGYAWPVLIK